MGKNASRLLRLLLLLLALLLSPITVTTAGSEGDDFVGWSNLTTFASKWLNTGSWESSLHSAAGFEHSYIVNFFDFALWAQGWSAIKVYAIDYDPYQDVDWDRWHRALAQHHDHVGRLSLDRIKAYDDAGYNVIVALDYAGKRSGGSAYCDYRLWPVHKYLSGFDSDQEVFATLRNIRLFIPSMEDIGCHHMTSPFLTTYIELWEPDYCETKEQWHYQTSQQCIDLINLYGGMAIIAHPTASVNTYMELENYKGIEIVNAYHYREWLLSQDYPDSFDYIGHFLAVWDHLLTYKDTKIWGFAVNDWYGPWRDSNESWIDCGKILVMVPEYSIHEYRNCLEKGSFFAIHDWAQGQQSKGSYPRVAGIIVSDHSIFIDTDGAVSWIADGQKVAEGRAIDLIELEPERNYSYVRAEISNRYGTVFTQPWTLARSAKW